LNAKTHYKRPTNRERKTEREYRAFSSQRPLLLQKIKTKTKNSLSLLVPLHSFVFQLFFFLGSHIIIIATYTISVLFMEEKVACNY